MNLKKLQDGSVKKQERAGEMMVRVFIIPYKTFKERTRLVREYLDMGYHVELSEGYIMCISTKKVAEEFA